MPIGRRLEGSKSSGKAGSLFASELSVVAPTVAREGRQLAKLEFEFELELVAVGAYFAAKFATNALK